jgi:hypothetical protein
VESILKNYFTAILDIKIAEEYLAHVKSIYPDVDDLESRQKVKDSYEFVIKVLGYDLHSTPIWREYAQFIKSWKV